MTKTLIVPVDGSESSERAWACAKVLADHFGSCDLVVLRADLQDADRVRPYVEGLAADAGGHTVRTECVTGDAAGAILRAVDQEPDAIVCMATHGRGRVAAPLVGSVATEVLRGIDTPMVLVGPSCVADWWRDPPTLVTCWTGESDNALLPVALSWSHDLAMDMVLLCVFHPLDVEASTEPTAQFAVARAHLGDDNRDVRTIALHDDYPSGAIADYVRRRSVTLLALTTRARRGLGRAVLGSVAMDVVRHSACPVLIVRAAS